MRSPTRQFRLISLVAVALVPFLACHSASPTGANAARSAAILASLDDAEKRWLAKRPVSYQVREQRSCECLPEETQEMLVHVSRRQGATTPSATESIIRVVYVSSGVEVPPGAARHVLTIQQLFTLIRDAVGRSAARIDITYDATYGFPTRIVLDYDAVVADDEFDYRVSGFVVES